MSKSQWSSRLSFIITTSAFAVGVGNIWRFPYMVGEGGGGAFLLVYLALCLLIGLPIFTMEIGLGRMAGTTPLLGYGKISGKPVWNLLGWFGVAGNAVIMSYYVMILAWVLFYGYEAITGHFTALAADDFSSHFDQIVSRSGVIILIVAGILLGTVLILKRGLQQGLEKYTKWMMLALLVILVGLAIWAATLDAAAEAYRWYLTPDFKKINIDTVLSAMSQLFFSVGVGMTIGFAFGSYSGKNENMVTGTAWIIFADTIIAVIAGFMLFPMIFSLNLAPDSGPNLIFVTMAAVFGQIAFGQILGTLFFVLLFLAGFTSLLTSVQGLKDSFKDRFKLTSNKALLIPVLFIMVFSLPSIFSYVDNPIQLFGMTVFDFLDFITNTVMLPLSGLGIVIFAGYVLGFKKLKAHLETADDPTSIGAHWKIIIQFVLPAAVIIILIRGLFG